VRGQSFVLNLNSTNYGKLSMFCLARDYTDIPGKCETCAYIDQKRRFSTSSQVQEHLKQAFLLHRGGMFMAERRE
jgi:hypothetical protein